MGREREEHKTRVVVTAIGEIVLATVAVAGAVTILALFPGLAYALEPFRKKNGKRYARTRLEKRDVERTVDSLVRQGLLKRDFDRNGVERLRLTKKGTWESGIRGYLKDKKKEKAWDGTWRVVAFDVPEKKHKIRRELRRAMQSYGFYQLQKSVWVYPYECEEFIRLVKRHLGISQDVLCMEMIRIENDTHLREAFKL